MAALIATVSAVSVPPMLATIDDARTYGAARYLSTRLQHVRMEAVRRSADVGMKFSALPTGYSYTVYVDGNRNGIRTLEIQRGIDREVIPMERLPDLFRDVDFGVLPGLPAVDGGAPAGTDPIRLGASDILTFTPIGTSSSGSLYVIGRSRAQYVIRIFGDSGKTRVLKFDARTRRWNPL